MSIEALAHYTRGMSTLFFVMWTLNIYRYRRRNRMMQLMFIAVCYLTFGFLKDVVFLFPSLMTDEFVEDIVILTDAICTPFLCAFFLEATRPGVVTIRRMALGVSVFAAFLPAYIILRSPVVLAVCYAASFACSTLTFLVITRYVSRYNQCIADNYSYTQDLTVTWVAGCAAAYSAWFIVYFLCFNEATWMGEVFFDLFSITVWTVMWRFSRRHHVITEMLGKEATIGMLPSDEQEKGNSPQSDEEGHPQKKNTSRDVFFAHVLNQKMEVDKIYLDPRLSLSDLALAVGSNRSYLSEFINERGKSFYDFVNEYRIAEACRIIDSASSLEKLTMADVATRSGFNSISSFNRYFYRVKGMTPTAYRRFHLLGPGNEQK